MWSCPSLAKHPLSPRPTPPHSLTPLALPLGSSDAARQDAPEAAALQTVGNYVVDSSQLQEPPPLEGARQAAATQDARKARIG